MSKKREHVVCDSMSNSKKSISFEIAFEDKM